jgi:hypothetical protein
MSIINGTLFAQAFHFFIAFYIIKHFFFKPIWAHIQAEQTTQKSLIDVVQTYQQKIRDKEDEIAHIWQDAHAHFAQTIPSSVPVMPESKSFAAQASIIEPADVVREAQELERIIIQKVKHVR